MEKKVRMADIAQRLGISIVSVSKGLAGKDGVSEEMREKIIATAKEMGYTMPQEKKKEKKLSGNIGILVADRFFADHAFYPNLYRSMLRQCRDSGFSGLLEIVYPEEERNCTVPTIVTTGKVDGLVFMGQLSRNYLRTMMNLDLPYILLDFYDDALDVDSVTSDNITGGFILTNHIFSTGRKKIGFVGSIYATSSIMDRYLGYTKALLYEKIAIRPDWQIEDRDEAGYFIPIQLPEEMPEAFLCSCDEVAYNLIETLKRNGYRVPQDVAVAGYDDFQFAQVSDPPLTTYQVNVKDMGQMAIARLVRRISGKRFTDGNTVVRGKFIRRGST